MKGSAVQRVMTHKSSKYIKTKKQKQKNRPLIVGAVLQTVLWFNRKIGGSFSNIFGTISVLEQLYLYAKWRLEMGGFCLVLE